MGADLTYECVSGNQYRIRLKLFRDCNGVALGGTQTVTIAGCSISPITLTLNRIAGSPTIITPLCATAVDRCNSSSGTYGVQLHIYEALVTLPTPCANYTIDFDLAARNNAITTLTNPGGQDLAVRALLNTSTVTCNSSPQFGNNTATTFTTFSCINQPVTYNMGATEVDGDELVYSLAPCSQGPTTNVAYAAGFSGTNPLSTSTGTAINSVTGAITFTPNAVQVGILCVRIEEFRVINGVRTKIGETVRDIQFTVLNCTNTAPTASAATNVTGATSGSGTYILTTCSGSTIDFDINLTDPNSGQILTIASNLATAIPAATLTLTGTVAHFNWSPTVADIGTNQFTITVQDNACPIRGTNTFAYTINVVANPNAQVNAGPDVAICAGFSTQLSAVAANVQSYLWTPSTGLSATNIANPVANPTATTTYTVRVLHANGCYTSDNVVVTVNANPTVPTITGSNSQCADVPTNPTYTTSPATYATYTWDTPTGNIVSGGTSSSVVVDWSTPGVNVLTVTVTNAAGCTASATYNITVLANPTPPAIVGSTTECVTAPNATYTTNPAGFTGYSWAVTGGTIIGSTTAASAVVDWTAAGTRTISVTVTNASGCTASSTQTITVNANPPAPAIVGSTAECINSPNVSYTTNPVGFNAYNWSVTGGTIVSGAGTAAIVVDWTTAGTGVVNVTVTNAAGCTVSVSQNVTVTANPAAPTITGSGAECTSAANASYTTNPATFTTYAWAVTGGTIVSGGTSATPVVDWTTAPSGTIAVTVTNSAGCTATATRTITITANPTAPTIAGGNISECISAPNTTYTSNPATFTTYAWSVTGGTIIGLNTNSSLVVDWTNAPSGTVTLTVTNSAGCTATVSRNVTINANPTAPTITGSGTECLSTTTNPTYTTSPTFVGYNWAVTGGTIVSGGTTATPVIDWTAAGTGVLNVTVTDANGCTVSATRNITVLANPTVPTITGGTPTDCISAPNATYTTNPSFTSYSWTVTGGTVVGSSTAPSLVVDWTTSGTGVINVTVTDANGCTVSATRNVVVNPNPTAPTINGSANSCITGSNDTYTTTPATWTAYAWSISAGGTIVGSSTASSLVVDWTVAGAQTINVTVTDANGCTVSATRTITANNSATAPAITGGSPTECVSATNTTYTTNPSTFSGYAWSVTGGTIVGSNTASSVVIDWTTAGTGVLNVTVTDANGCTVSATRNVTVNANPTAPTIAGGTATDCVTAANATYTVPNTFTTYSWAVTGGAVVGAANTSSVVVDWTTAGAGVLNVTVTDANGCTVSATRTVTVNANPVASFTVNGAACASYNTGTVLTFASTSTAGSGSITAYSWNFGAGATPGTSTTATQAVTYASTGTKTVTLTVTNSNGCTASASCTININTPNSCNANFTINNATQCLTGNSFVYTSTAAASLNGTITSYSWNFGTSSPSPATATTVGPHTVTYGVSGSPITVSLSITDSNGCTATSSQTVTVNAMPTTPTITGSAAECIVTPTNPTYSVPATYTTYAWGVSGGGTFVGATNGASVVVDWTGPGTRTLTVTVTNASGCTATATRTVVVNANPPTPTITGGSTTDCVSAPNVTYSVSTFAGYAWTVTGGTIIGSSTAQNVVVDWTAAGSGVLNITVTDANGCTVSATRTVTINANPTANAGPGASLTGTQTYTSAATTATGGTGPYTYIWSTSPVVTGNGATTANPTFGPFTGNTTICVTVTDANGCTASSCATVTYASCALAATLSAPTVNGGFNITCNGVTNGSISTSVTGNTGSITYVWSGPTAIPANTANPSNLAAGTYTVTIGDGAGCTITRTITLTQPLPLTAGTCTDANDACQLSAGQIRVQAQGGTAPYSVTWVASPVGSTLNQTAPQTIATSGGTITLTGADGGATYTFTITDANGCQVP